MNTPGGDRSLATFSDIHTQTPSAGMGGWEEGGKRCSSSSPGVWRGACPQKLPSGSGGKGRGRAEGEGEGDAKPHDVPLRSRRPRTAAGLGSPPRRYAVPESLAPRMLRSIPVASPSLPLYFRPVPRVSRHPPPPPPPAPLSPPLLPPRSRRRDSPCRG